MKIAFGALAPSLSEQLAGCGLPSDALRHFDLDAKAITRLRVRGILTDSMVMQAHKKLLTQIEAAVTKMQKGEV